MFGEGDQRAALNQIWEWSAIAVAYFLLKEIVNRTTTRTLLITSTMSMAIALSALGMWQHFVWLPAQGAKLVEYFELKNQQQSGALSPEQQKRFREVSSQIDGKIASLDQAGQQAMLGRVRDSSEALGRFSLANSFGGFLAVVALWILSITLAQLHRRSQILWAGMLILVLYCLLLTKSRTAIVGFMLAVGLGAVLLWARGRKTKEVLKYGAVGVGAIVLLGSVAFYTGGIDREVISESTLSLRYRFEYWHSTWDLICDHPIFGIGPGNFRQHYLKYKLPGSSEEILDPHQFLLDVWANGGLIALFGMGLIIAVSFRSLFSKHSISEDVALKQGSLSRVIASGAIPFGMVWLQQLTISGFSDEILFLIFLGWLASSMCVNSVLPEQAPIRLMGFISVVALLLHLSAAGGIGMPAICLLLLVAMLFLTADDHERQGSESKPAPVISFQFPIVVSPVVAGIAFVLLMWSSLVPVMEVSTLISIGQQQAMSSRLQAAQKSFRTATEKDSLNPEPWQMLALSEYALWQGSGRGNDSTFDQAIESLNEAIKRDPLRATRYRSAGEWWLDRARKSHQPEHAGKSEEAFAQAMELYPHHAMIIGQRAVAQNLAGESAEEMAVQALELDDLNRDLGHSDKYLPNELRRVLLQFVNRDDDLTD